MHIVLLEPEIPQNAGNIARTCAVTNTVLHLIKPLGFSVEDKYLKRAGLDYWKLLDIRYYENFQDFLDKNPNAKIWMATTKAKHVYTDVTFGENDYLMFGKESAGIPEEILLQYPDTAIRIPMLEAARSLNLSNSVAIIIYEALRQQVERLLAGGVHGMFPLGTNGEAYALSFKEKEEVLATVIDQVKGRVPVYAGTGCITTAETIRMSKRAEEMGADALSIITPSFALASQKELYDHYVAVAKQVNIPIILYNIPPRTGNKLLPETVQALCRDVDVIVGAKDSSGDIENLKAYIRLTRELDKDVAILAGNDGAILTCLKEGGAGGIAGRANIWPATVAKIYDCFKAGDLEGAQAAQDAIAILQQTFKYGNPNTIIKTAVALQGHNVGKCRAPFNYVPEEGLEAIKKVLAENAAKGLN